jgi:Fe-S cluster assembly protein SufD
MTHALDSYAAERDRAAGLLRTEDGFAPLRDEAWRQFVTMGFPTTHQEEWRFTSVASIAAGGFVLAARLESPMPAIDIDPFRLPDAAAELVFVAGRYVPSLSRSTVLPREAHVESLASAMAARRERLGLHLGRVAALEGRPFVALNAAFLDDGAWIDLPAGSVLERPLHLLFVAGGGAGGRPLMSHPRLVVILGENSQASVVETFVGGDGTRYFTNAVTEIVVGENAGLEHYKLQHEGADAYHVGATQVRAERHARYASHSISLGGALVRNDLTAVLDGEGVECTLNGLYAADAERLVDNHTTIDHVQPHGGSREMYRGILADRSRGVFNGKIIVRPNAQKTDAKQTNRALLLSEDARINTKPQLEIFANDVKCTHGAAVGQLDDDALFYLRSRGLGEGTARRLLTHAFVADVLNRMPLETVRVSVDGRLQRQLARALPDAA